MVTCGTGIATDITGTGIVYDAVDYAVDTDDISRARLQIKYAVEGIGATVGGLFGAVATIGPGMFVGAAVGAAAGRGLAAGLYSVGDCYLKWNAVQAEEITNSNGVGQSYWISTSSWYCTNRPFFDMDFTISPCVSRTASPELNVDPAALIIHFMLPWPRDTYRNHNVHLLINNIEIGNLTNTIPEGYYMFPFNASILNYASEGTAQNIITLRMDNLNGGHYVVATDIEIVLHLKKLKLAVVASNQTEANNIVEQLSGTVASLPDFGIYPENVGCLNSQPKEGQSLTIEATISNFGTVGMANVPVDLYVDSVKVNSAIIGFLPAFANQSVDFVWTAVRGTNNITIVVNGAHEIPESDYSNNQAQTSITVFADDVAIANVTYAKNVVGQGFSFNASVTAANRGEFTETFNVTLYANTTYITSQNVTLTSGATTTITFTVNTTGLAKGNYTISAYASPVLGETDTADNNFKGGWVVVAGVGDLTGGTPNALDFVPDGKVLIDDVAVVSKYYGQKVPPAPANCDVSGPTIGVPDGKIDITDVATVAKHFGEHYP